MKDSADDATVDCFDWVVDGRSKNGGARSRSGPQPMQYKTVPVRVDERLVPIIEVLKWALARGHTDVFEKIGTVLVDRVLPYTKDVFPFQYTMQFLNRDFYRPNARRANAK